MLVIINGEERNIEDGLKVSDLVPLLELKAERLAIEVNRKIIRRAAWQLTPLAEGDKIGKSVFELKDYFEENFPEYDIRVSVLGHMQRGGSPS